MSKPNDNELDEILDKVSWGDYRHKYGWYTGISNRPEIKAQLSAHFLSQALEILGEDEFTMGDPNDFGRIIRNKFRAELRKAFQSKYAPKEGQ